MVISIHAPREGGDGRVTVSTRPPPYFNPRPPRGGRRQRVRLIARKFEDFNPRPPRGGRQRGCQSQIAHGQFQSTPPARGATAPSFPSMYASPISIHAPREGGDRAGVAGDGSLLISIHAPREGGDPPKLDYFLDKLISIHAPREGGDLPGMTRISFWQYFNPRPPRGGRQQRCTVLPADL